MRILITGGTSGIGFEAVKRLAAAKNHDLVIGVRAPDKAPSLLKKSAGVVPLDLESLAAVRTFVDQMRREKFDALVLNAGLQCVKPEKSKDGFELTFAVNHLAHYLIARELAPNLNQNGRVILTSSGTHDPELKTGIPAPRHADAMRLAYPERDERDKSNMTAARRAYSSSKLCNVMTARELAKRLSSSRRDIATAAYDPGFTPGTGLARSYPGPVGFIFRYLMPYFVRQTERVSSAANSGALLADLTVSQIYAGARGGYFAVRGKTLVETPPSTLARDDAACTKLWNDSAELVGLKP